jgi:uncharacterized protein with HEPN domain
MSKRDWSILFEDMLESITKMEDYAKGLTYEDFAGNPMVVDAVVRNLEIIGEAARNVPPAKREETPEIPWKKLSGIRNRVVHEYFGVDLNIIWFIVRNELSPLKQAIQNRLHKRDSET